MNKNIPSRCVVVRPPRLTFYIAICIFTNLASLTLCLQPPASNKTPAQAQQQLQTWETQIRSVVPKLKAAVVCIEGGGGSGSGVIVSEDGLILTAAHVIDKATELTIVFLDGRRLPGKALGTYGPADAGMAQIIAPGPFPFVEVSDGSTFQQHDPVIALGHPGGFDALRGTPLRFGYLNSIEENFIQSDSALIGGDSGGPTFDLQGRVIGIHSHISEALNTNRDASIRAFHVAWDSMKRGEHHATHYSQSIDKDHESDPWILGLQLLGSDDDRGWVVEQVAVHSPADRAGIKAADILVQVNGKAIPSAERFLQELGDGKLGETIRIQGIRADEPWEKEVTLMRRSQYQANGKTEEQGTSQARPESPQKPKTETPQTNPQSANNPSERYSLKSPTPNTLPATRLQELKDLAKSQGGRLQLSRDELQALRAGLTKKTDTIAMVVGSRAEGPGQSLWNAAFQPVCASYQPSIHRVFTSGRWTALATAVSIDGLLITKGSEVKNRDIEVELAPDKRLPAQLVHFDEGLDLALIEIPNVVLRPMPLAAISERRELGTLCAALGTTVTPVGFGTISVTARPLDGKTGAYLGIRTSIQDGKLRVTSVQPGSPANASGLKIGDTILTIDAVEPKTPEELTNQIQTFVPGDYVNVTIQRDQTLLSMRIKLIDGSTIAPMPGNREQGTDGASTAMSKRRWGFRTGIQHDCAIHPRECGGPLVDLEGRLLGINIARAGRIHSYAIPIEQVASFVQSYNPSPSKETKNSP